MRKESIFFTERFYAGGLWRMVQRNCTIRHFWKEPVWVTIIGFLQGLQTWTW